MIGEKVVASHPEDSLLRADRLPHIWCPGCGLGAITTSYTRALQESDVDRDRHVTVSGIGCTGRVAGYVHVDSFHTTHGRPIPFATGLKIYNPELEVTVISGDGDLFAIGGNHFIHAARRDAPINVFCVNNFNYAMTGGQHGPTSPVGSNSPTTPAGVSDRPFNLPRLALALGANYVARWTSLHVRQLQRSMQQALNTPGFTFIEILSPCPIGYGKSNGIGDGLDEMRHYRDHCVVDDKASIYDMEIDLRADAPVVLGVFRRDGEREKPRD